VPALRTTSTLRALEVARETGLLDGADAQVLEDAWRTASRIRNAVMLVRGRPSDTVPSDSRVLSGVARLVGRPGESGGELVEDYRRVTRHARTVVERLFYG
jgi:glutamate-ammonia-ligase adenylyltransferase